MTNIDWDFIAKREGNKLKGYVPDPTGSDSGVTIASGFDLGARGLSDLAGLPDSIIEKLKPFLGFKGAEADEIASNLTITNDEAKVINDFSKKEATELLSKRWKSATGTDFSELPKNKATVIASVAFQYGNLETETPNFWRQVTNDDWAAAEKNLRDFKDKYDSRRKLEADYYVAGLTTEEVESKKKFERELARAKQYGIQEAMISGEEGDLGSVPTRDSAQPPQEIIRDVDMPTEPEVTIPPEVTNTLPVIEEITEKQPIFEPPRATKSEMALPSTDEIYGGYTGLYGNGQETYGERIPSQLTDPEEYEYHVFDEDGWDIWGAAFRQNNFVPSLMRMIEASDPKYKPVEGYSSYEDEELKKKVGGDGLWLSLIHI